MRKSLAEYRKMQSSMRDRVRIGPNVCGIYDS